MKANEIIRNKGIEYIRDILIKYPDFTHMTDDARMFIDEKNCIEFIKKDLHNTVKFSELRKIIESHDRIERLGGLGKARLVKDGLAFIGDFDSALSLANNIIDVESCL